MLIWTALWYCSLAVASSFSDLHKEFSSLQKEIKTCRRQDFTYVCDPDYTLDIREGIQLDYQAEDVKNSTPCLCSSCPNNEGVSIGIFLKANISNQFSSEISGKLLAETIRHSWNLGTCDNDIIIVLITLRNILGVSVGSSVQRKLTEGTVAKILEENQKHFDSGFFYKGLISIIRSFKDVITGKQSNSSAGNSSLKFAIFLSFVTCAVVVSALLAVYFREVQEKRKKCINIYEKKSTFKDKKNLTNEQREETEKLRIITDPNFA